MHISRNIFWIALTAIAVTTAPAWAEQARSLYTSIANKDCKFAPIGTALGDAEDQLKICPGLGGTQVLVNSQHTRLRIGLRWPRNDPKLVRWAAEAWSAGFVVEWRGQGRGKAFEPYAAIVRMKEQRGDQPAVGAEVLAVIRVAPNMACAMGAVDARANREANELARALADAKPRFVCGQDAPVIGGTETPAARKMLRGVHE